MRAHEFEPHEPFLPGGQLSSEELDSEPSPDCEASPAKSASCAVVEAGLAGHLSRLWRFALTRCGDQAIADDLVQATCVRALERAEQFTPGTRLDSWLYAILESVWHNLLRSQKVRHGRGLIDIADAHLESADADEETRVAMADAIRSIDALPAGQRSVLLLVCIEGFSYEEAAYALGIPVGTVMSRLSSARTKLRTS